MTLLFRPALLVALVTTILTQQVRGTSSNGSEPGTDRVAFVPVYVPPGPTSPGYKWFSPVNNPPHSDTQPPLPTPLIWDSRLPFENGPINITSFISGEPVFTIQNRKNDHHHTFEVVNTTGDALVKVHLKPKAQWGYDYTYNTPSGVRYAIFPHMLKTDRWMMQMEGNNSDGSYETLIYLRGHKKNIGNIYFQNYSRVATFTFDAPKNMTYLAGAKNTTKLEILSPTNIGSQYFIGLWALVKLRMDKYGP